MEFIEIHLNSYPTDATYVVWDSLHSETREYQIEGDGWKELSKYFGGQSPKFPFIAKEGTKVYEDLHAFYLHPFLDYEVIDG